MFRKFFSVIALISFLVFSATSANASKWCPIYDYSVNNLLDNIKNNVAEKNVQIWNIKSYTEKGINYVTANFGDSNKNIIKFCINKNGSVQWITIRGDFKDITSFNESPINSINEMQEKIAPAIYLLYLGLFPNMQLNDIESKNVSERLVKKMSYSIDEMFKKLKNKQFDEINDIIDFSESIWSSTNKRYFKIRNYIDYEKKFIYFSLQAYK